jgi:hypothetical protein
MRENGGIAPIFTLAVDGVSDQLHALDALPPGKVASISVV